MATSNSESQLFNVRNYWKFASVCQFFHTFFSAFRYESFDTEDFEKGLLEGKTAFGDIVARLLRTLTSHKQVTYYNYSDTLVREYTKRPEFRAPWIKDDGGDDRSPVDESRLSAKDKIDILYDLCEWQLEDAEKFRERVKVVEGEFNWRVDPVGMDAQGYIYWLFDDNRLYRQGHTKPAEATTKAPSKKSGQRRGRNKRRQARHSADAADAEEAREDEVVNGANGHDTNGAEPAFHQDLDADIQAANDEIDGWRLVCRTVADWQAFPKQFENAKDSNEKRFYSYLTNDLLPTVVEYLQEKESEQEKLAAIANRKRSSRIWVKEIEQEERDRMMELKRFEQEELARRRREELGRRRGNVESKQNPNDREARLNDREARLLQREQRIQEQMLQQLKEEEKQRKAKEREDAKREKETQKRALAKKRAAERARRKAAERKKAEMEADNEEEEAEDEEEEEDWWFDCICGVRGQNLDDGDAMIACSRCNKWQHIACMVKNGHVKANARDELEDVDFVCPQCKESSQQASVDGRALDLPHQQASIQIQSTNDGANAVGCDFRLANCSPYAVVNAATNGNKRTLPTDHESQSSSTTTEDARKRPIVGHSVGGDNGIYSQAVQPVPGGTNNGFAPSLPSNGSAHILNLDNHPFVPPFKSQNTPSHSTTYQNGSHDPNGRQFHPPFSNPAPSSYLPYSQPTVAPNVSNQLPLQTNYSQSTSPQFHQHHSQHINAPLAPTSTSNQLSAKLQYGFPSSLPLPPVLHHLNATADRQLPIIPPLHSNIRPAPIQFNGTSTFPSVTSIESKPSTFDTSRPT
ncbi:hypothetical protein BZG36_01552 [Bifiguratus adelaidae]|uniref:Zinc finger PHD-type domain-containing protein n=1 Tax=Bifiguratus adelaidae TaxID=1938954 RepID=A0A261Y435_9FUNG|nr:hypothetical protein BZG36_01552 [Bifiguratus adelaidae]